MEENIVKTTTGQSVNFIGTIALTLTTSDTDVFEPGYLYIGADGNVTCVPVGNALTDTVVFEGLKAGSILPVLVKKVLTATTVTSLLLIR
jgi:hypothetical protein